MGGRRPARLRVNVLALGLCRAQQKCVSDGVSTGGFGVHLIFIFSHTSITPPQIKKGEFRKRFCTVGLSFDGEGFS